MATLEEFEVLKGRVTDLEATMKQLLSTVRQMQSTSGPLPPINPPSSLGSIGTLNPEYTQTKQYVNGGTPQLQTKTRPTYTKPRTISLAAGLSTDYDATGGALPRTYPKLSYYPPSVISGSGTLGVSADDVTSTKTGHHTISSLQPAVSGLSDPAKIQANTQHLKSSATVSRGSPGPITLRQYQYSSLDVAQNQIRLLAVQRSKHFDAPLRARVIVESLDTLDKAQSARNHYMYTGYHTHPSHYWFTALSYTWGSSSSRSEIYIDGQMMSVARTLETALRYLRNYELDVELTSSPWFPKSEAVEETFWWIDAICINQNDTSEKNVQVSQMTRLFSRAAQVYVWLGEVADDSDVAMHLIRQIGYQPPPRTQEEEDWLYIRHGNETHRPCGPGEQPRKLAEVINIDEYERKRNTTALARFFSRPWFQRVWIRQEIALPKHLTVHCGLESCTWQQLARTAAVIDYLDKGITYNPLQLRETDSDVLGLATTPTGVEQMVELDHIRRGVGTDRKNYVSFANLLAHSKQCQASDARDKVYSFLGLVDPSYILLKPDYTLTPEMVWKQAVSQLLSISLDFLGACQNGEVRADLPSWVPNLSHALRWIPFHCARSKKPNPDKPNLAIAKDLVPQAHVYNDRRILHVIGWNVDNVQTISTVRILPSMSYNAVLRAQELWIAEIRDEFDMPRERLSKLLYSLQGKDYNGEEFDWRDETLNSFIPMAGRSLYEDPTFERAAGYLIPKEWHRLEQGSATSIAILKRYGIGRQFARFSSGRFGLVPEDARKGDCIVVFPGCSWEQCLRPDRGKKFMVVGEVAISDNPRHPFRRRPGKGWELTPEAQQLFSLI